MHESVFLSCRDKWHAWWSYGSYPSDVHHEQEDAAFKNNNKVWQMETMFLLSATLGSTCFSNGYQCVCCPLWVGLVLAWELEYTQSRAPSEPRFGRRSQNSWRFSHGKGKCVPFHRRGTYNLGLPCSRGPKCSAAGDGGGEGGKFVVSSTTKGEGKNILL